MKIVHWSDFPNSGMHNFAAMLSAAERAVGLDSSIAMAKGVDQAALDDLLAKTDVHVAHTWMPPKVILGAPKTARSVYMAITPIESFFHSSLNYSVQGYGFADPWMNFQHGIRTVDAIVCFNPRYKAILRSFADKSTFVFETPTGIDKAFWHPVPCEGKYAGNPAVLSAESCPPPGQHNFKPYWDLCVTWPLAVPHIQPAPCLHIVGLRPEFHRWYFPLVNLNDCSYTSHIWPAKFSPEKLRAVFCAVDYYIGLVHYGDTNMVQMQASACGCKTISYNGNYFSDFWINFGPHDEMAAQLADILNGKVEPRKHPPIPDISETATFMKSVYEKL